jgi:sugar (pentulose or hexulose) kinase
MNLKTDELILSIDAGTQSVRAALIDLNGNIVKLERTKINAYYSANPGWAEQDPIYFKTKLAETTKKLLAENKELHSRIKAVSLTSQRGTVINLDKSGKPIRPAIVWLDQRQASKRKYPSGLEKIGLQIINMRESVVHAIKNAECNWLIQNQYEIWNQTEKYLFLSGYLTYYLTGEFTDSIGNIVGYMPFDYKKQNWAPTNHRNYKMFPVEHSKLARLCKPAETLGYISKKASEETGIPADLPLIAAASDKASEVLGAGVFEAGKACLSYGTTATVQTTLNKYREIIRFFPSYPSAVPGHYNPEIMIYRGYWMIKWFSEQFGQHEAKIAKKRGVNTEKIFDEMIQEVPPGSMGLTLQPYWSPGVKIPGTEAKGAIIGFGDVHTKAHIYRAIIEGLAYSLKDGLLRIEKRTKTKTTEIMVAGGGSQNDQIIQLTSDIFDLPVNKPHTFEASALGAAINAAIGSGYFSNYETAVSHMCRIDKTFYPDSKNSAVYKEHFEKVYLRMYKRLQKLYHEIRDITGYPEKI